MCAKPWLSSSCADARHHALGLLLGFGVGVPAELEVDAPDVVGLAVHQHTLAGVERRVEPEPALGAVGGKGFAVEHHVGDQEAVLEDLALDVQPERAAHRAARAVGHDQPVGTAARSGRRRSRPRPWRRPSPGVTRATLCFQRRSMAGSSQRALDQVLLQVVLLQVHHARAPVAGLGQQVEGEDLAARRGRCGPRSRSRPCRRPRWPTPRRSKISSVRLA